MKILRLCKNAYSNLFVHTSRSVLTILGIVIGVASIIVIVSIGSGAEELIAGEISSLGSDILWIEPGREPQGPLDFATTIFSKTLKERDVESLLKKTNAPEIVRIAPAVSVPGSVSYRGETYRPFVMGWSADFLSHVFKITPERGTFFTDIDIRNRARVAIIGSRVKDELFGQSDAIGENITIGGKSFRVIGVLPPKGQIFFFDIGELVLVPYSTAQTYLLGIDHYNEIWVQVRGADSVPRTVRDIELTLRERHGITDPEKNDFYILTQDNLLDQLGSILNILTIAISSIVAISLVVGGIGVMNIMLVSVMERTREIGLRKALGATESDIIAQFLTEAVLLAFVGGVLGVIAGIAISYGIAILFVSLTGASWTFSFPYSAALLGFGVSALVGLFFGLYPARKASLKDPIESLRYE
ncbi:MAG: hypothetical protein A2934_02705 [Candidatus Sungbacteria bacterium RIFCSPLOWO2_01_FULL_47_10]|uniref:Multidrug ABC transporter substrate-binding protein n=1 Tax=Candidatus Sungbacteria bacterium RIFCSPLOWO2_01_FULL_47_10 TaxID=1802276 RepID=A0A1G2KYT9_9BACT|nr:MAG: hypothetical protein A2934_02705 [Candidatus Sungbacteria bacterium RIFCSPLOWO2_01_FULL_47_10]